MYARVIINRVRPGMEEEASNSVRAGMAANQQQPGYRGQYYLLEAETNRSILITLWEEDPSPHTFHPDYQQRMDNAVRVLAESVVPRIYQVIAAQEQPS
ncbi:MAG TPA: hypothetical protein VKR06_24165 [Ktedonosporobacter sp.]|nr:hypothetical protein [Ktedonosporobacter sp.]